jgi:tape measure domain-containing protein
VATEEIGALVVRIEANLSNLEKGLDQATRTIRSKMESAAEGSKVLLGGLAVVGAGLVAFGAKALTMAGQMEQSQVAFTTMLGSAEKATALMKELQRFGAETPFEFPEIQKAAKSLLAFGVGAEDVTETLRRVGDIASGVGAPLGEIAELYGKAKTQGRLFAEDINQLTGRGIPIIKELASQFGVSESEVRGLVESGKIGFPQLELAFKNMTAEGSQFGGMMDAQSKTLPGMWSNLMDNIGQSAVVLGQTLIDSFDLKTKLAGAIEFLGQISSALQQEGLQGAIDKIFPPDTQAKIVIIAGAIMGALVPAFAALAIGVWAAVAPLLPFMAAGAAVAALALLIYKNWEPIKNFFPELWEGIKTTVVNAANAVWEFLKAWGPLILAAVTGPVGLLVYAIAKHWDDIKAKTTEIWNTVKEFVVNAFKWLYDHNYYFQNLVDNIKKAWDFIKSTTEKIWNDLKSWLQGIWQSISGTASDIWNGIASTLSGIWDSISSTIQGVWNNIVSATNSAWDAIASPIKNAVNIIWDTLSGLASQAWEWGSNLLNSFADGIMARIDYLKDMASNAVDSIKRILGFHSPAEEGPGSDADTWAPNLMNMFAAGIKSGIPDIKAAVAQAASSLTSLQANVTTTGTASGATTSSGQTTNFADMFNGATFNVRSDNDAKLIAREIFNLQTAKSRASGVVYST